MYFINIYKKVYFNSISTPFLINLNKQREKRREKELLEQGAISTTSDPLDIYKRLFIPLEMPEWQDGLPTTTTPTTTTQVTTETEHWFWIKYSKCEKCQYINYPYYFIF